MHFMARYIYTVKICKYPAGGTKFFHAAPDVPLRIGIGSDASGGPGIPPHLFSNLHENGGAGVSVRVACRQSKHIGRNGNDLNRCRM